MRWSSDFEDIIYVLDNREEIIEELYNTKGTVKSYIKEQFNQLLVNKNLDEGIACALPYSAGTAGLEKIKKILKTIGEV